MKDIKYKAKIPFYLTLTDGKGVLDRHKSCTKCISFNANYDLTFRMATEICQVSCSFFFTSEKQFTRFKHEPNILSI